VRSEFVDLDLAELTDVADALALEGAEVGGDSRVLEVDDTGEGLVEEAADGEDGEVAGFGLYKELEVTPRKRIWLAVCILQQECGSWP
jgi:hypothetical protein